MGMDDMSMDDMMMMMMSMMMMTGMEDMGMMAYDGGQVTMSDGMMDMAAWISRWLTCPKLVGIGYFAATTEGQQQAAAELGNVTVTTDAPTEANIDDRFRSSTVISPKAWMASSSLRQRPGRYRTGAALGIGSRHSRGRL